MVPTTQGFCEQVSAQWQVLLRACWVLSTLRVWKLELRFLIQILRSHSPYLLQSLEFTQTSRRNPNKTGLGEACELIAS